MKCRKCGSVNDQGAWVCAKCEYILDPSFLGADILNERTRDGIDEESGSAPAQPPVAEEALELPFHDFGNDALILGRLGDADDVESFVTDRTGGFLPQQSDEPRQVYVTGEVRMLLLPHVVLRHTSDAHERRDVLSPFEGKLFDLIDGMRTLDEVQSLAGISDNDLCAAVGMLHDKALIEKAPEGSDLKRKRPASLEENTSELAVLPPLDEAGGSPFDGFLEPGAPKTGAAAPAAVPLPLPSPSPSPSPLPRPVPVPVPSAPAPSSLKPALKPAMRPAAIPGARTKAPGPPPPGQAPPVPQPSPPQQSPSSLAEARRRAQGFYDVCMKELSLGHLGRAWGYAKMAADADPGEEKYQTLLRDWDKLHGGHHGERASTPAELMASAQDAETRGDYEKAVELLERLVAQAPSSASGWNKLAVLLATRMKQYRGAYNAAIKAVEIEPGNMTFQSNMMKILAKVDDADKSTGGKDGGGLFKKLLGR